MKDEKNYPYLLAVHVLCIDGQLHQDELRFLNVLEKALSISDCTKAAAEEILVQEKLHVDLEAVLKNIPLNERNQALSLAALASHFDGYVDITERRLLERIKQEWKMSDEDYQRILKLAHEEANRMVDENRQDVPTELSKATKFLNGLEAFLGQSVVDRVIDTFGTEALKERIKDCRIEALLSGPKYDKAIEECRSVGLFDIEIADACLQATAEGLSAVVFELDEKIAEIELKISDKPAQAARESLKMIQGDREQLSDLIGLEIERLKEIQIKKRRAMNYYSIAFMGRSKAGKSTLHAVVTGGGWDQIGVGRQNTTKLNRVYEWHNIRIIDTPGIATPGGKELEDIAESIIDEADLICFVVTNNNQQTSEFEFLAKLKSKGKPLLVLLNVKEDLSNSVRLRKFLENPDVLFSKEKDRLGGHIDRIRRDAAKYYGTENFPIIPVQLFAAQLAQQNPENENSQALMKASRIQEFLDAVRLSLLNEGLLRRSQNLLGSTVSDVVCIKDRLNARAEFYLDSANSIREKKAVAAKRLKEAHRDYSGKLELGVKSVFLEVKEAVPEFSENHWDSSEDSLNKAWLDEIASFNLEQKIQLEQEKWAQSFSNDLTDLLDEVGQELILSRQLAIGMGKLDAQESSVFMSKTLKWGSSLAGVVMSVALLNGWNPGGWVLAGVGVAIAIVGFLGSLFESKASKQAKAVKNISKALLSQLDDREQQVVASALEHFNDQCQAGKIAVLEYFDELAAALEFIGETLSRSVIIFENQSDILNLHFAARILDFKNIPPSESTAQKLRMQIGKVNRIVGQKIDIEIPQKLIVSNDLSGLESVIQEKITLNILGVKS